jgi:hypothetical protein
MLDFVRNTAYVTVQLSTRKAMTPLPHIIGSDRSINVANSDTFSEMGLSQYKMVTGALARWEPQYVKSFLDGDNIIDLGKLFHEIVSVYKSYVYFEDKDTYPFIALWVMGTYLFPLFPAYPMILLNGPHNSGKSRTLFVSALLAFNSEVVGDPTGATLFRMVDRFRSSLFFDDTEWLAGNKATRVASLLKVSYKRGVIIPRVGKNTDGSVTSYEIYSPKMFTNISGIENVLGSRTITVHQRRKPAGYPIEKSDPKNDDSIWARLRHQLYLFTFNYWGEINALLPAQNKTPLENRDYELYAGILAIASLIEKRTDIKGLHKKILAMALRQSDERKSDDRVFNPSIIAIQALFTLVQKDGWYSIQQIMDAFKDCHVSNKGINEESTAGILKGLNIGKRPGTKKRFRVGSNRKRLTHYLITKKEIGILVKRYDVDVD